MRPQRWVRQRPVGFYREADNSTLRIARIRKPGVNSLRIAFPAQKLHGVLYPVAANEFVVGEGKQPLPVRARVRLRPSKTGTVEAVEITIGKRSFRARRDDSAAADRPVMPPLRPLR